MVHPATVWAAARPRIRRVWIAGADRSGCNVVSLELEPVPDSEETLAVWTCSAGRR